MSDENLTQEAPVNTAELTVNSPVIAAKKSDASIEAQNKVAELRKAAREKINALLRDERGVPQPTEQAETRTTAAKTDGAAKPTPPAVSPSANLPPAVDYAQITRELQQRAEESARAKQEAAGLLAQAQQKEAELKDAVSRPLEFLEKAGYTPDEWQALLLAGGQESAEMKKAKQAEARAKKAEEAALKATEELKQYQRNVLKAQAIKEIEPQLAEFPLTAKLTSPEQLLEMIQKHYRETGQKVSVQEAAKTLEAQYEKQFAQLLSDEKVAKKVGKGKAAAPETKAEAGPSTLSNRVSNTTSAKTTLATLEERRNAAMRLLRDRGVI